MCLKVHTNRKVIWNCWQVHVEGMELPSPVDHQLQLKKLVTLSCATNFASTPHHAMPGLMIWTISTAFWIRTLMHWKATWFLENTTLRRMQKFQARRIVTFGAKWKSQHKIFWVLYVGWWVIFRLFDPTFQSSLQIQWTFYVYKNSESSSVQWSLNSSAPWFVRIWFIRNIFCDPKIGFIRTILDLSAVFHKEIKIKQQFRT